ncbi:MAG: hypothetical protein Q8P41_31275 [Pseudomonadota bacterium]|nr:hypothetical protein [Pseudomonadota bacterium]
MPALPQVLARAGVKGPVALISAGWRHDEPRDEPLREAMGATIHNLGLYAAFRVLEREASDLVSTYTLKQSALRRVKERYRMAIVPALAGCRELYARRRDLDCPWFQQAVRNIQAVDALFLAESDRLHHEYDEQARPFRHRRVRIELDRLQARLNACDAVLIAGGHVGVLRNRLAFFGFDEWLRHRKVFAWSAGAMALTDRVVLFHDHTAYGVGLAEILDRGLGLLPGVVFLPHARERLDLADNENVAILAHRFAPAKAIGLQNGALLTGPQLTSEGTRDAAMHLGLDGTLMPVSEVHALAP